MFDCSLWEPTISTRLCCSDNKNKLTILALAFCWNLAFDTVLNCSSKEEEMQCMSSEVEFEDGYLNQTRLALGTSSLFEML